MSSLLIQPSIQQVAPTDPVLTNLSIGWDQGDAHFARKFFPVVPVSSRTGRYQIFSKADWLRDEAKPRAPGTPAAVGGWGMETAQYVCDEYAIAHPIPDEIRAAYQGPLEADASAVAYLNEKIMLAEDRLFVEKYLAASTWGETWTGVSSASGFANSNPQYDTTASAYHFLQWNATGSDPIVQLRYWMLQRQLATGQRPNKLGIGPLVWNVLADHAALTARLPVTQDRVLTPQLLAALLGLDEVVILGSVVNTAQEGKAASLSFVAGNVVILAYVSPSPAINKPSSGYIFTWSDFEGVAANGVASIRRWRDERVKTDWYEGHTNFDMKLVTSDAAMLLTSVIP